MDLRTKELRRSYRDADRELTVIESLTHTFSSGQSYAIVGRSGVGKSTLLHLLGGLDIPSSGQIFFGDQSITDMKIDELAALRGAKVGFIFQFHHLLGEFSALENVAMPLSIVGVGDEESDPIARELLIKVGLKDRLTHTPGQLSGGEQQRVAVARAMVRRPGIILADEPTGNLDSQSSEEIQGLLRSLCSDLGATLIIVTHNLELASRMDHVLEMTSGGMLIG